MIATKERGIVMHEMNTGFEMQMALSRGTGKATPASVAGVGSYQSVNQTIKGRSVTVRSALPADAASLAAIGAAGFTTAHGAAIPHGVLQGFLTDTFSEKQLAGTIANPEIQLFVAEVEQTVVGVVALNPSYRPDYLRQPAVVELSRFYLHLDWIGYGIGSALIAHALQQAARTGYRIVWLRVWQGNKTAIQFYQRWGFKTIASDSYAVGDTLIPVWVMIHSLTSDAKTSDAKTNMIQWQ
jgi:GNAT superfamily N-acetyltransferase